MKIYISPQMEIKTVSPEKNIASVEGWINGEGYQEAGITKFSFDNISN